MGLSGNLETMGLPEVLQWIAMSRKTGTLYLHRRSIEKRIVFENGTVYSSWSNHPRESLGQFLIRDRRVSEEQLFRALLRQEQNGQMLGGILAHLHSRTGHDFAQYKRATVLRLATERGIEQTSPAYAQLDVWLSQRPVDALFDAAIETIKSGLSVLTPEDRADRIRRIVEACHEVADASGGLSRLIGMGGVSNEEEELLDGMAARLRGR